MKQCLDSFTEILAAWFQTAAEELQWESDYRDFTLLCHKPGLRFTPKCNTLWKPHREAQHISRSETLVNQLHRHTLLFSFFPCAAHAWLHNLAFLPLC